MLTVLGLGWGVKLAFLSGWEALALWAGLAAVIIWLGIRSMAAMWRVRKWTAIGIRLAVAALAVSILGGVQWEQTNRDLTVMVLRDVSDSTSLVRHFSNDGAGAANVQAAIDQFLTAAQQKKDKRADDRIGQVGFAAGAQVDELPDSTLQFQDHAIRMDGDGTDPAAAIQLGLATMGQNTMRRMLLLWDGNATVGTAGGQGDQGALDQAIAAAAAQHVPIDVMPLHYRIQHEVTMERLAAPPWKSPDEAFSLEVVLKSTNPGPVVGNLSVRLGDQPMDMDAAPGLQPTRRVVLQPGVNVERVAVAPLKNPGAHVFHALWEPQSTTTKGPNPDPAAVTPPTDTLLANNSADAFTFVKGRGRVLVIDGTSNGAGQALQDALKREHIELDVRTVEGFPSDLLSLQNFDAVILQNVPLGLGGLNGDQDQLLASYVRDLGGGLVMVGGDQAFGAGGWQGSKTEKVLPLNMDIPAKRELPKGALLLVLDHSGSMGEGVKGSNLNKQRIADESAVQAVKALSRLDYVGVISFDSMPTWVVPMGINANPDQTAQAIRDIGPAGGTNIYPALEEAFRSMQGLSWNTVGVKHILLLTDGQSNQGDFDGIASAIRQNKITLSTIGIGDDVDSALLQRLAILGGGSYYPVSNPNILPQIFIKEATIVRRTLIHTNDGGIPVRETESAGSSQAVQGIGSFPQIKGLVLSSRKNNPLVHVPLVAGANNDPLLAHWQVGLGRSLAFTSDGAAIWDPAWVGSSMYDKFWAQSVRLVARPAMGNDVEMHTSQSDGKTHLSVEAFNPDGTHRNFLSVSGVYVGPDMKPHEIRLGQTGPGVYQASLPSKQQGDYVMRLTYRGQDGKQGILLAGVAVNGSAEMRAPASSDFHVEEVAQRTGGRIIPPFDAAAADLFSRNGLVPAVSLTPIWSQLIPLLLALVLVDVAARRIAWDYTSIRRGLVAARDKVRQFTTVRPVQTRAAVEALKKVRQDSQPPAHAATSDTGAKFEAGAPVEGDLSRLVGGATGAVDTARSAPPDVNDQGGPMSGLMEAKRRARRKMEGKE
jgi:Mg-chelatase subunit ChlD